MPVLVIERGNDKGLSLKVEPGKSYLVGRDHPQAAVKLTDPLASRAHFQISSQNGVFKVKDAKSRNGTLLNDEKLPPEAEKELKIGDKIQVGETIFSFLSDQKEETAGGGLTGKTVGGYNLLERVGRGGMGTVYRAEQVSLKRQVALKVLSAKLLSDPVFVERFVEEARAAGGLIHPNIVQVIDVGSDRGIYYFSMEFMGNASVGDIVAQQGPVPWERALEMMTDATRGLVFAEKQGIVHRDIKPDNLMLTAEGTVKIGDLGLAKKTTELAGDTGQIFGTPHFIAPEQAQGKPVDNRADIYALGASFYRVLTGKTPFSGDNVKEILVKQIQEEPRALQELAPQVPDELAAVLAKMMRKKPEDRYRSAQGLLEDLERIRVMYHLEAHGAAVSARRSKAIAVVLAVAVLALGGAAYYYATNVRTEIHTVRDPSTGPVDPNPTPAQRDPNAVAADALNPVLIAALELDRRLGGGPDKTWQKHEKEWLEIAARFEAVAKQHPETENGGKAAKNAADIRGALESAKTVHQDRSTAANDAWAKLLADVEALLQEGKFAAAAALLQARSEEILRKEQEFLPADAESVRAKLYDRIKMEAAGLFAPLLKELAESAAIFPGERHLAARKAIESAQAGLVADPAPKKENPASGRMKELHAGIQKDLEDTLETARETARAAVAADQEAYFKGYLGIRRWAPESAGEEFRSPFYDYQWDKCLQLWNEVLARLKTTPFRDRVKAKIAQYGRFRPIFEMIAAKVKARELKDPSFPESVRRRTNVLIDGNRRADTTPEGLWVLRVGGGGNQKAFLEFREMTPFELYAVFLNRGEGLGLTPAQHLDLAVFLAEAGQGYFENAQGQPGHHAWAELALAGTVETALKEWVEREATIDIEWHAQVVAPLRDYEKKRASGAGTGVVDRARKAVEDRIRALLAEERFYRTDTYILHHSEDGAEGAIPDRLFPAAVTDEVIRTLGVPGAVLPVEEKAAEAPPKEPDPPVKEPAGPPREPGGEPGPAGGDATKEKPK